MTVPVIAVLTKYEALVDRVKSEFKGQQVAKSDILNYAKRNVFGPLKSDIHAPIAIVQTHRKGIIIIIATRITLKPIR